LFHGVVAQLVRAQDS